MSISARNSRRWQAGLPLTAILALAGCAVGPDFVTPDSPPGAAFPTEVERADPTEAAAPGPHPDVTAEIPAEWWRLFGCRTLDDAVRQGLAGSPTLVAAQATLRQAEDNLRAGQGVFYPQIDAGLDAARERPSNNATPLKLHEGIFNLFTLSTSVSYALDVFGGNRRAVEALGAAVDYQRNAARAAGVTLAADIANTMIAIAAYDAEIDATLRIVAVETDQLRLAGIQATAGTGAFAAVLSLQTQLEATRATIPPLRQKRAQALHLLAVLAGRLPGEEQPVTIRLAELSLPHTLPVSVPSRLVRQRPDILQAEASLHGASAQIGVATAALLPSVTLDGAFGLSDTSTTGLLAAGSKAWSFGAGVAQPIFRGGTLSAQRQAAIDAFAAAEANYRQTVLAAFGQVADALRALDHDASAQAIEDQTVQTASRALALTQANFRAGLVRYSDVLIADAQEHQAEIADIQARAILFQDAVALFAALGGGWWNAARVEVPPE